MNEPDVEPPAEPLAEQPAEHLAYARLLELGSQLGFALLVLAFAVYLFGLLPPLVPLEQLPGLWQLPSEQFRVRTHGTTGWGWVMNLAHGDVAGLVGVAVLASCSVVGLIALVPRYARLGDRIYVVLCLLQVLVMALAASGWLGAGAAR